MNSFNIHEKFKILVRSILFGACLLFAGSFGTGLSFKIFGQDCPPILSAISAGICLFLCINKWVWSWMSHLDVKIQMIIIIVTIFISFNTATILGL